MNHATQKLGISKVPCSKMRNPAELKRCKMRKLEDFYLKKQKLRKTGYF